MASSAGKRALSAALNIALQKKDRARVSGLTPAASAYLIAEYLNEAQTGESPQILCICPTDDLALELATDIDCFLRSFGIKNLAPLIFPTWERSPYGPIAPSLRTRFTRIQTLTALTTPPNPTSLLITSSLVALSQSTLPPDVFRSFCTHLTIDQSLGSRETLVQLLKDSGYLRVDTVEDLGTFAVRGEILDVFPPNQNQPLRILLFDDTIESIRTYDPSSQRTVGPPISTVVIPPARELLINPTTQSTLRDQIKHTADELGISRNIRDPLLSAIQMGSYPTHSDAWIPFAYPQAATLIDYLSPQCIVIWIDEMTCFDHWKTGIQKHLKNSNLKEQDTLTVLPSPQDLFQWGPALAARLSSFNQLFFDRLNLQQPQETASENPTQQLHVQISSNKQIHQGSTATLDQLETQLKQFVEQGFKIWIFASTQSQLDRIRYLLNERGLHCLDLDYKPEPSKILLSFGALSHGFQWDSEGVLVFTEGEILGIIRKRTTPSSTGKKTTTSSSWTGLQALEDLSLGDAVVHHDHGIGLYRGLARLSLLGAPSDFLLLEYASKDKLYLPVYRLNVIQKYTGGSENIPLDRLGNQQFEKTKARVKESVKNLAFDLVQLYAQRKISTGFRFSSRDAEFQEFEAKFAYDETPDQLTAIDETLHDLESGQIMDRIICGDVGYGKTEVAMRAAFRVASDGKQVVVLVPTTLLARQHTQSFQARFKDYPIRIEALSRFKTKKEQNEILQALQKGTVDIIIGTHRILSKDVQFHDLGLIVIDEEHRFGVEHKELLKVLKVNTPVLTLTATPIPRTLHMALAGLRDISLIKTPPVDRLPIRTYIAKYDETLIQQSIENELARGGQVFYLHNQVSNIFEIAARIQALVPTAQIGVGHGQMTEKELEKATALFYERQTNVFVCTTIIESGLDLPLANTIIINRADRLGLAQLYQIRGRVGRGQTRAYAYLLLPENDQISEDAKKRLEVLQKFVELGSGFHIASHDLEIRGRGDLLGPQQSGSIAAVGFDLYTELLEEAIHEIQGQKTSTLKVIEPDIKIPYPAFLSENYIADVHQRLSLYRRFSAAGTEEDIQQLEEEVTDRFGPLPDEAQNLLWLLRVKLTLRKFEIDSLTVGPQKISFVPGKNSPIDTIRTIALIAAHPQEIQLTPDSKLVVRLTTSSIKELYFQLEPTFQRFIC